ncbi:MAG TPA: hypothetical protein VF976_03275 [Gemmatimonadales bacterium]
MPSARAWSLADRWGFTEGWTWGSPEYRSRPPVHHHSSTSHPESVLTNA